MNILSLLSGTGFIVINKSVAQRFGLYPAIMLGELASKYLYYKENNMLTEDGFFFVTIDDMEKSTTLSRHKQEEGLKVLQEIKFIEMTLRGLPSKRHFKIAEDVILSQFVKNSQTTLPFGTSPLSEKLTTNNKDIYTENIDVLNNNKGIGVKFTDKNEELDGQILEQSTDGVNWKTIEETFEEEPKEVGVLFPAFNTSKPTEFINSIAFETSVFQAAMKKEEKLGVDIIYYRNLVDEWCEKLSIKDKRKKRTARGWIATARQFMRSDNEKGKLRFVGSKKEFQDAEAKAFLSI